METLLFSNIKKLYENGLYSCVIPNASMLYTLLQNDRALASSNMEYQVLLFLGNAHFHERHYRQACRYLDLALVMRKSIHRSKNKGAQIENINEKFSESETRCKLAICYRELGEHNMAIITLQAVPAKSRTPRLNMMLAKLLHYGRCANTTEAINIYKDVVRECPFALEAIEALMELGVDGIEVNSLVLSASPNAKNIEWLSTWIKGQAQIYSRKHLEASKTFQSINESTKFYQNDYLLTLIGKCLYYYGSFAQAQHYLETAVMISPYSMDIMTPLAVVYEYNQKLQELDKLTSQMTNLNEFGSEHWFILAQNYYVNNKLDKASSFTHKAISVDARNIEAQLLRGKICLQLKRHKDAIYFFRAAQCIANYRFEVYKGLFHCYVGLKRLKEAQTMCGLAVRYFRNSPRSYVMFARTLFHSTNLMAKKSAKKIVAKALQIDEHYAPAVALMAEVCHADGETQEAIGMLKKQIVNYPHHKLFTMLGDILSAEKDLNGALEYYTIALSMEPTYQRALDGVNALGQASRNGMRSDQDVVMTATTSSTTISTNTVNRHDGEWPIECEEPSVEGVEISSPVVAHDDDESDTLSDPFWPDVDTDLTN